MADPESEFKKGSNTGFIVVVLVLLLAGGVGAFLAFGGKKEEQRLDPQQAAEQKKTILVMPLEQQLAEWRKWGGSDRSAFLKEEALKQLAWAKDPAGVDLAVAALKDIEQKVRATAASALAEHGSPSADKGKEALLVALKEATAESKPQIAWALVELGEARAFDDVMALYRLGHLSGVQRLDKTLAFNPEKIVRLVTLDKLASLAGDESSSVRQLVATVLSRNADPKYTDTLIKLLQDPDGEISREAAPGLGRIGDEKARGPLLEKLKSADQDSREKYLKAIRNGIGTSGLVLALDSVSKDTATREWHQIQQIFAMVRRDGVKTKSENSDPGLADPGGGDALAAYIDKGPHVHWQWQAAMALAEVGDIRAVPTLAKRLRMDEHKIYSDDTDYEMLLKRNNTERVESARMIADLALLHPNELDKIRGWAEDAVIFWIHELPSPHANGLRALAAMQTTKDIENLRKWANPNKPLPLEGQQPPMPEEWVVAQSALRYVGWMKDEQSWKVLEKDLTRRDKDLDITMDGLMAGGVAILGMTLRALGVGASDGFAEWGDPKAFKLLMDFIEPDKENEQSRLQACSALAWVATPEDMKTVIEKIQKYSGTEKPDQFHRACFLETVITRPVPEIGPTLLALITPDASLEVRHQAARAIGKAGLTPDMEGKLFELMNSEALMVDAALALALGGTEDVAARAIAMFANKPKEALEELQELWYKSFGYWSHEDLDKGHIFRWVDNATAIAKVEINSTPQEWAPVQLARQFDNLLFDNGPHSFTRVVLRVKLMNMAKGDDAAKRAGAIRTLQFMKEQGVLLALRSAPGETGRLAGEAYHDLLNPKIITGVKDFGEKESGKK